MNNKTTAFSIILLVIFSLSLYSQKVSKEEDQLLKLVEKNHKDAVRFLEETVNINSGTFNVEGVKKVGVPYRKMLDDMGFTTRWVDMPGSMKRGGHLVGEIKGKKGKRLLLIGHMDTVFEPDDPFQKWQAKDSIAIGPGAVDMKGGNMIMFYALKALQEAGQLKDRQIIVILHGDEENSGRPGEISRRDITEAAKRSDIALAFEFGTGYHYATIARRGGGGWTLTVTGKQAHSQGIFSESTGAGAIYETARILTGFYKELQEQNLTFSPGIIVGGTEVTMDSTGTQGTAFGKSNLVANTTIVKGDLRFLTEEQRDKARAKMKAIVAQSLPHTHAEIVFSGSGSSMPPTPGNMALLKTLSIVSVDLGQGEVLPFDPGKRGGGDISGVAQYLDCLDGLGANGGNTHAPGEYVDLRTLQDITKRAAVFIYRLTL